MIDVHSWTTGNARKVYIMLEETGLPYQVHPVDISRGEQFAPDFLRISPNGKIPAIVDRDRPGMAYGLERYTKEAARLYGVMDRRLADSRYLGGEDYSIADIATFPWCQTPAKRGVDHADYPHVRRWFGEIAARPAVKTADEICVRLRGARAAE